MAKLFGSLVGAVKQQAPTQPVDSAYERSHDQIIVRDSITLAAAPIATVIQAAVLGWESVLDDYGCKMSWSALGAGVTLGLGDVTFPAALDAAVAANAAGNVFLNSAVAETRRFQPLWQKLGYASLAAAQAVGAQCELLFTIGGGAATGTLNWKLSGARRI